MPKREGKYRGLRGAVALSHFFLRERVRPGDRVVDATCGNGHDTLFLAGLVGPAGKVWGFDIQDDALAATRVLLDEAGCLDRLELVAAGHECLSDHVTEPVQAVVFNLGYLPGGDKTRITRPDNTLPALEQAAQLLQPGGIIIVVLYSGHPGGAEECRAVDEWGAALSPELFNVWRSCQPNCPPTAPYLILVEKRG
ncbi:MAG: hypothetical protein FD174_3610 [Geobacteraceae bacterium]|nr:MAG: hypothetical protein FD174_3610 [Geobacteraceae bacterium]